jgi:O-phosphoseryl-tRNA(Cys) synthetase
MAVEICGVDSGVTRLIEQLRRESEQLAPDSHRCAVKRHTNCGWTGELAALSDERGSYPLHLFSTINDFFECRIHTKPEKMQDGVLPAGNIMA